MAQDTITAEVAPDFRGRAFWARSVRATLSFFTRKPLGGFGVAVVGLFVVVAALAPYMAPHDPSEVFEIPNPAYDPELAAEAQSDPSLYLEYPQEVLSPGGVIAAQAPSGEHLFGIDMKGRDILSRVLWGSRLSLLVGMGAAVIAVSIGLIVGTASAYFSGTTDVVVQRFIDALQAFPALVLLLLIVQVVQNPDKYWITLALGILGISQSARIVRSAALSVREEQYVLAARVVGSSDLRIIARHVIPNIMAPTIVIFTISIGAFILAEASLAFIGFGDPTAISWGKMVDNGRVNLATQPWLSLFAGGAITLVVLGFNLAGDALRDVLDPRMRGM